MDIAAGTSGQFSASVLNNYSIDQKLKVVAKDCAEKQKVRGSNSGVDKALVAAGEGAMHFKVPLSKVPTPQMLK